MDNWETFNRRIVVLDDIGGYSSKFTSAGHGPVVTLTARARGNAIRQASLDRGTAKIQSRGDGELCCWPAGTSVLDILDRYLPALHRELERLNEDRDEHKQIRLRLAVAEASCALEGDVLIGDAPIVATRLVDSKACRDALKRFELSPLVVVIDDGIYQNAVAGDQSLRKADEYTPIAVRQREKGFSARAWLAVFGANAESSPHWHRLKPPIIGGAAAAVIGTAVAVYLAVQPSAGTPAGYGATSNPSPSVTTSTTAVSPTTAPPAPSALPSSPSVSPTGIHREVADNRNGTPVYTNIVGTQADGGARIQLGTPVDVSCYAPNATGMQSINALYLIADGEYRGDYAPANTFANGDPLGVSGGSHDIDPAVPPC